jgi:hypothetical protein
MIVNQQRADGVRGGEQPVDRKPPFDHEHRLVGVHPDPSGRVVEVPVEIEPRVLGSVHPDQRTRGDGRGVLRGGRHAASLAQR